MLVHLILCINVVFATLAIHDVPEEVLENSILANLLPLSMTYFGLTCTAFWTVAQRSLLSRFGDGTDLDIELLHEGLTRSDSDKEKEAIKKLLIKSIPPLNTPSLETMEKYDFAKFVLFTDDSFDLNYAISKEFSKLSRVLIKRRGRKFDLQPPTMEFLDGDLIDLLVPYINEFSTDRMDSVIESCHPTLALKLLLFSFKCSTVMQIAIATDSLDSFIQSPGKYNKAHPALAVCMANTGNMDQVLHILENYTDISELEKYLMNWTRFAHLKPVILLLFKRCDLDENMKRKLTVNFAEMDQPLDYYEDLHGSSLVQSAEQFLRSYDESTKKFTSQVPNGIVPMEILEVAILKRFTELVLEAVIDLEGFKFDLFIIAFATKMNVSTSLIMKMSEKPCYHLEEFKLTQEFTVKFDLPVFTQLVHLIIRKYKDATDDHVSDEVHNLLAMHPSDVPALDYVRVCFEALKSDLPAIQGILNLWRYERFVDAKEIRHELYQLAIDHGLPFFWHYEQGFSIESSRDEARAFFDRIEIGKLVKYIPGTKGPQYMASSFFIAFNSIASRPGGLDLLANRMAEDFFNFEVLKFFYEFPNGEIAVLDAILENEEHNRLLVELAYASTTIVTSKHSNRVVEQLRTKLDECFFNHLFGSVS